MTENDEREDPLFADEIDVDLTDDTEPVEGERGEGRDQDLPDRSTEFLGVYPSVEAYLQSLLGELMHRDILWILEHLDYGAVRRRFEADGARYYCEEGSVYRRA